MVLGIFFFHFSIWTRSGSKTHFQKLVFKRLTMKTYKHLEHTSSPNMANLTQQDVPFTHALISLCSGKHCAVVLVIGTETKDSTPQARSLQGGVLSGSNDICGCFSSRTATLMKIGIPVQAFSGWRLISGESIWDSSVLVSGQRKEVSSGTKIVWETKRILLIFFPFFLKTISEGWGACFLAVLDEWWGACFLVVAAGVS